MSKPINNGGTPEEDRIENQMMDNLPTADNQTLARILRSRSIAARRLYDESMREALARLILPSATGGKSVDRLVKALRGLLNYAERKTCLHDETHRAGLIWEICDSCGKKWSDGEGGKPLDAHMWPKEIEYAQGVLDEWKD